MNKNMVINTVVSATLGGIIGGAVTYFVVNKSLRSRYEDWANEEIAAVKKHYSLLRKENGLTILGAPDQEAVKMGKAIIQRLGYSGDEEVIDQVDEDTSGEGEPVFAEEDEIQSIWDRGVATDEDGNALINLEDIQDTPEYVREEGKPYLISEAEFFENEDDYELDTLTYYELDDTLCDEKDVQIDRVEEAIGVRHLHMFNTDKRNAKNSIYIRNDKHQSLYEVILNESSYASVVMGVDDETLGLKEPKQRPRKMRDND